MAVHWSESATRQCECRRAAAAGGILSAGRVRSGSGQRAGGTEGLPGRRKL